MSLPADFEKWLRQEIDGPDPEPSLTGDRVADLVNAGPVERRRPAPVIHRPTQIDPPPPRPPAGYDTPPPPADWIAIAIALALLLVITGTVYLIYKEGLPQ